MMIDVEVDGVAVVSQNVSVLGEHQSMMVDIDGVAVRSQNLSVVKEHDGWTSVQSTSHLRLSPWMTLVFAVVVCGPMSHK